MDRRVFMAVTAGAALGPVAGDAEAASGAEREGDASQPSLIELRAYRLRSGPMEARFAEYAKNALLPGLNRAGVKPVGAFTVLVGPDSPTLFVLFAHPDSRSLATLASRLEADAEYVRAAAPLRGLAPNDPPYIRVEVSLMASFAIPGIAPPPFATAAKDRVFELRTYESPSASAGRKKIEMFEQGGEIPIFRRTGLVPVFFGRNLAGPRLPSLTYMVVFPDLGAREKSWTAFREDPEWVKLRAQPAYAGIVSNIHNQFLRPADYSQL